MNWWKAFLFSFYLRITSVWCDIYLFILKAWSLPTIENANLKKSSLPNFHQRMTVLFLQYYYLHISFTGCVKQKFLGLKILISSWWFWTFTAKLKLYYLCLLSVSFKLQTSPYLLSQFNICTSNLPGWMTKQKAIYLRSLQENIQKFGKINTWIVLAWAAHEKVWHLNVISWMSLQK